MIYWDLWRVQHLYLGTPRRRPLRNPERTSSGRCDRRFFYERGAAVPVLPCFAPTVDRPSRRRARRGGSALENGKKLVWSTVLAIAHGVTRLPVARFSLRISLSVYVCVCVCPRTSTDGSLVNSDGCLIILRPLWFILKHWNFVRETKNYFFFPDKVVVCDCFGIFTIACVDFGYIL